VKEQIMAKLMGISDLEDRLLLKNVLHDVFWQLCEHSAAMYQQLEQRVFAEMEGVLNIYDVYATIASRQSFDPVHYFLRPMQQEDLLQRIYDLGSITETAFGMDQYPLMKVFFHCDYRVFKEIISGSQSFHGAIITDQDSINATYTVRRNMQYQEQITKLYEIFLNNNIPWKTVFHPFIFRFADVILQKCDRLPATGEAVREIKVDFADYSQHVRYDMVPLWNVEPIQLNSNGFPIPCVDKINYEHVIPLDTTGMEHGYLASLTEDAVSYIRRTPDELTIVATTQQQITWDFLRILKPKTDKTEPHEYQVVSNATRQTFTDIMARYSQRTIKTEAELRRLIDSYVVSKSLHLSHVAIVSCSGEMGVESDSYELNFFLTDEIRRCDYQNRLLLYFTSPDKNNYLFCDIVSFVVAEVQMHYPEYKCEGIIL
jgi:hypothetical protein